MKPSDVFRRQIEKDRFKKDRFLMERRGVWQYNRRVPHGVRDVIEDAPLGVR